MRCALFSDEIIITWLFYGVISTSGYHPRCRRAFCSAANRTYESSLNGTDTIILRSSQIAGMYRASSQSVSSVGNCIQRHSCGGALLKSTPCRHANLPRRRHAARRHAKLRVRTSSFKRSRSSLTFLRFCRTLIRNRATASALAWFGVASAFTICCLVDGLWPRKLPSSCLEAVYS